MSSPSRIKHTVSSRPFCQPAVRTRGSAPGWQPPRRQVAARTQVSTAEQWLQQLRGAIQICWWIDGASTSHDNVMRRYRTSTVHLTRPRRALVLSRARSERVVIPSNQTALRWGVPVYLRVSAQFPPTRAYW